MYSAEYRQKLLDRIDYYLTTGKIDTRLLTCSATPQGSPLHWACAWGNTDTVLKLLNSHDFKESTDANGHLPFVWACYHGNLDVVKLLVKQNDSSKMKCRKFAAIVPQMQVLRFFDHEEKEYRIWLESDDKENEEIIDINEYILKLEEDDEGDELPLLYWACKRKSRDIVRTLLQRGYDDTTRVNALYCNG